LTLLMQGLTVLPRFAGKRDALKTRRARSDGKLRAKHIRVTRLPHRPHVSERAKPFLHKMARRQPRARRFIRGNTWDGAAVLALPRHIHRRQTAAANSPFLRAIHQPQNNPIAPLTLRQLHRLQQPARFDVQIPRPVLARIIRHAPQQLPMPLTRRLHQQRHPP